MPIYRLGGASADLDMLCGGFHYNRASMLFAALPDYLLIANDGLPVDAPADSPGRAVAQRS
ncbi:hypothetical protein LOY57_13430 [Pseudomonas moraviensis]|nr:hypothetical protein [Pseudomonas moraviensis]UVL48836.1 hypothetical protein LOY57_13430 [Pseudomonas moraviensis]